MARPKLRNYTTTVPPVRSIAAIEDMLAQFGATDIAKSYVDSIPTGITFQITVDGAGPRLFRLEVQTNLIVAWLKRQQSPRARRRPAEDKLTMHARAIGWRLLHDLIHAQLSLIEIGLRKPMQALLSELYNPTTGRTLFEHLQETNFKALPAFEREAHADH